MVLIVGAGVGLGALLLNWPGEKDNRAASLFAGVNSPESRTAPKIQPQISDENEVSVEVSPVSLEGDRWMFEVAFNTHTVNLDFNPKDISYIRSEVEGERPALVWTGAPLRGDHHSSGQLIFPSIAGKKIEIVVRNVAGVPERIFKFGL